MLVLLTRPPNDTISVAPLRIVVPLAVPPEKTISAPLLDTDVALHRPPDVTLSTAPLEAVTEIALPPTNALSVLSECERLVARHPEIELLSARQRLFNEEE